MQLTVSAGARPPSDAQSSNPPVDPEMLEPDAAPLDADTDYEGEDPPEPEERDGEDLAPAMP